MKGYVQVYTGGGKGKTTAALGISLRAAGAGLKVYIAQFMKKGDYSEIKALAKFSGQIRIEQFGTGKFVKGEPAPDEIESCRLGFETAKQAVESDQYDMIILDEANVAASCGLISVDGLAALIDSKPDRLELIITGRGASETVIEKADLVTEMREIKHYYQKGVHARTGIEK